MRDAGYGRIIMTASAAGIYGNFGQANYSMAKLGLHGFAQTLAIEGKKRGVHVNTIAPIAGSRMTETVLPPDLVAALKPEFVSPLVAWLCHESCEESGSLFEVGGGFVGKLRWERTQGALFRLSRPMTPEGVQAKWSAIVDFGKATHPTNVTESMQPILGNLGTAKGKGGNEYIDVDEALGFEMPAVTSSFDERDLALYALGVGAARDPLDTKELAFVYEMSGEGFKMLPTFPVAPALKAVFELAKEGKQAPGLHYGFDRVLHGEQYTEIRAPWPTHGKLTHKIKIKDIFDKGKNALVVSAITTTDENGTELAYNEVTTFVRGAGGWGGDRGPSADVNVAPSRAPDAVVEEKTSPNQALLYRLSGDWNPLHADPAFAKNFGFERPILHGLCTFGFAARHVISKFAPGGDPRFFKSIKVRFAELGASRARRSSPRCGRRARRASSSRRRSRSAARSRSRTRRSSSTRRSRRRPRRLRRSRRPRRRTRRSRLTSSRARTSSPGSRTMSLAIRSSCRRSARSSSSSSTSPDSAWTIDVKNGAGAVTPGAGTGDCTLELTDADFMAMTSGKADAMKLYMGGKLKISGDVMASQKLSFLQKIDPKEALAAITKKRGAGAPAAAPAAPAPAAAIDPASFGSADVFTAIEDHVARNPDLVAKIGKVFVFKLTGPDSAWTIDVKNGKGGVQPGAVDKADTTLELTDADFLAMTSGKADAMKLYMGGKLKIGGDVMASQKLELPAEDRPEARGRGRDEEAWRERRRSDHRGHARREGQCARGRRVGDGDLQGARRSTGQEPGLAKEVGAMLQFNVKNPTASWVVDLTGAGAVREGTDAEGRRPLRIDDADLAALCKDPAQRARPLPARQAAGRRRCSRSPTSSASSRTSI